MVLAVVAAPRRAHRLQSYQVSLRGGYFRKSIVKGDETYIQAPRKSKIGGIVGGQLVAQGPYRVR